MTRRKAEYVVLMVMNDLRYEPVSKGLDDTESALRWIKALGVNGVTYQVASFASAPVVLQVETVEKRKLVPAE